MPVSNVFTKSADDHTMINIRVQNVSSTRGLQIPFSLERSYFNFCIFVVICQLVAKALQHVHGPVSTQGVHRAWGSA